MNVAIVLTALLPLVGYLLTVRRVPEGQAWTVHRFGRFARTLKAGRHPVWPLIEKVARQVPLTGHHLEVPTGDLSGVPASADLYYQILDPLPAGDGLERLDEEIRRHADAVLAVVVAAQLPADAAAPVLADALKAELNRRLDGRGLRVVRCALHAA
ncbi:MAG: hypothetical protein JSS45_09235 [Proteobacteria bacterium]|nr:hypothetical protein [Pseudomonadota bacterium]